MGRELSKEKTGMGRSPLQAAMAPLESVIGGIKCLAGSGERFLKASFPGLYNRRSGRNPMDILKRLQREAFSDIMKLRDRQDKVDRALSLFKAGGGGPFQNESTYIKGIIDAGGVILLGGSNPEQACGNLDRAGTGSGVDLKFIFERFARRVDRFVAEFMAGQNNLANHTHLASCPLELVKLKYLFSVNDWLSFVSIPIGARYDDFHIRSIDSQRSSGLVENFLIEPPLSGCYNGCGAGITAKGSNIAVSLGELISGSVGQHVETGRSYLGTFAQLACQPGDDVRLTLSGLWRKPREPGSLFKFGKLTFPLGSIKGLTRSEPQLPETRIIAEDGMTSGSICFKLDSEFNGCTNLGGWMEMQASNPRLMQWGLSLTDTPEDELGWGFRVGRKVDGRLIVEGFGNANFGRRAMFQPGIVWVMDGQTSTSALVLRSRWCI